MMGYNQEQLAALHKWKQWNDVNEWIRFTMIVVTVAGMLVGFITKNYQLAFFLLVWSYVIDGIRERYDSRVVDRTYNKVEREGDDVT